MRVAEYGADPVALVGRAGSVKPGGAEVLPRKGGKVTSRSLLLHHRVFQQHLKKLQQIPGEKAYIACHQQAANGIILQNPVRHFLQLPGEHRLMDEQRILFQDSGPFAFLPGENRKPVGFVAAEIVIHLFRCLGDPVPGVLCRAVIPAFGQIRRAELLRRHGQGGQELVVQCCELLRLIPAHVGNVQGMVIFLERSPVILPGHSVLAQPAIALEHTFGQNNIHIPDRVLHAPQIGDVAAACVGKQLFEIQFVEHPLDEGHTDLKGMMRHRPAILLVQSPGILFGHDPLTVEFRDGEGHFLFHTAVGFHAVFFFHRFYRDHIHRFFCVDHRIVHNDYPVFLFNLDSVHADAAGEHQAIVGIELAELAFPDLHIQHDAAAHGPIEFLPDEGQPGVTAHAVGTGKGIIHILPGAEVQRHAVGAKHVLRLLLPLHGLPRVPPVKDAGEIHVKHRLGKRVADLSFLCLGRGSSIHGAEQLMEERVVLLCFIGRENAAAGFVFVQAIPHPVIPCFFRIAHQHQC